MSDYGPLGWSDDERLLAETVRRFALDRLVVAGDGVEPLPYDRERIGQLGALGVLGMRVEARHGSTEGTYRALGIVAEELSRGDLDASFFVQLSAIAGDMLTWGGSEAVQQQWLPALASGTATIALGLSEPNVGSDAAQILTRARRDGDDWLIDGEKASVTFAGLADAAIVLARTGGAGAGGISSFLVPLDADGVTRTVYRSMGGIGSRRGSLFFDQVRVPFENLVGNEGDGFRYAMTAFDFNRAVIALACIGAARQSIDETIVHIKNRQTFAKPLSSRQGIVFPLAEHQSRLHAARLVAYEALTLADLHLDHTVPAAMAKWMGPLWSKEAIQTCLLFHGWVGYDRNLPFEKRLRDVIGLEIGDGTAEIMKGVIARRSFGLEVLRT